MKTMYANIKKALKAILADYMTAMEMYGEALNRRYRMYFLSTAR